MDDSVNDCLSSMQERLFGFYKEGKLTDITWAVGAEGCETEYISAHSSVCALSGRLKELMLAHSNDQLKSCIRVPPSLTLIPSDFRCVLHLAYTGTFAEGHSFEQCLRLCELFEMPLGIDACLSGLKNLLTELLIRPSIDSETQNGLRDFFINSINDSKMKSVHPIILNFFRMHPLIFDSKLIPSIANSSLFIAEPCLSKVPVEWVIELLKKGKLWMQHPDGFVYFGGKYMSEAAQFVERLCTAHNMEPLEVQIARTRSMLAPLRVSTFVSPPFGYHSTYAYGYNYSELEGRHRTHDNYPPNEWKIAALTGYITRNWDGRQVLAGLDITYRNFETGNEEVVEWEHQNEEHYTVQTVFVPEDDVIIGFEINCGWLIDRVTFTTRKGVRLNQLGTSDGGNRTVFDGSSLARVNAGEWSDDEQTERSDRDDVIVSLHGISYKEILSRRQLLWNKVVFHFASIDRSLVETLNPEHGPIMHQILKDKQFLL
ncbi:unnamed protein product [Hydatigera taeniaeformis]|uniref:BTB domain-containing protein n=1 Tax=Hydatigena taeniaeformis TaxID=6205 RepID=A0A0R3WQH4_HYDTA|nr:unnamed protein product [Hydatigera taeniaeformis]